MAFKKRKVDRRKLDATVFFGAAEVCETRALLSADGVCLPAVDAEAVVVETAEVADSEEIVEFQAAAVDGELIPELAVCTMLPIVDAEMSEDPSGEKEGDGIVTEEGFDPSLMFYSFLSVDGGDAEVVDGEETAVEDFDPSWMFRSFVATDEEVVAEVEPTGKITEDEIVLNDIVEEIFVGEEELVDVTTLENYDPSWAFRGNIVDGEKVLGEEAFVDGEVSEEEIVYLEDGGEVPVRYYLGMNFRGNTDGELPVEILAMSSGAPSAEAAPSVMGPVATSGTVVAPVVNIPVVVNQPVSLPVITNPTLAIPVNNSGFTPLFVEEEELPLTTFAPVVSEIEPLVSEVENSASSDLDSGFGDLIPSATDRSDAPVGELTPIFEEEQEAVEPAEVPASEEVPSETEKSVGAAVVHKPVVVASRANYGQSIDEFMSEFAMSGFAG